MDVVLALALALATIPQAPGSNAEAPPAQIERLIQDGKADEAVKEGRRAVAAHPDDIDLRLALARALAATARRANRQINVTLSKEDTARGEVRVMDDDLHTATLHVEYDPALFEEAIGQLDFGIKRAPQVSAFSKLRLRRTSPLEPAIASTKASA